MLPLTDDDEHIELEGGVGGAHFMGRQSINTMLFLLWIRPRMLCILLSHLGQCNSSTQHETESGRFLEPQETSPAEPDFVRRILIAIC